MPLRFSLGRERAFPSARAPAGEFPVRFRPRLVQELRQDHDEARAAMRALLDACRRQAVDDVVAQLGRFGEPFRRAGLLKSVQLYPYLHWALQRHRAAAAQLKLLQHGIDSATMRIDAAASRYLDSPWSRAQREHYARDLAQAAQLFARTARQEESAVFPLYMPPGNYRYVDGG
jgi:hypothetical protein